MKNNENKWTQAMDDTLIELIEQDFYSAGQMTSFIDKTYEEIIERGRFHGFNTYVDRINGREVYFLRSRLEKMIVNNKMSDKLNAILSLTGEITKLLKQYR